MDLENKIKYKFNNKEYLDNALTHSSYSNENALEYNNERLEFLGDAVLELVISEKLYKKYPEKSEGDLTKMRASLVCEPSLAKIARKIGLGEYLHMGNGEEITGGRKRDSILSDAVEAIIGAVFLDGNIKNAKELIINFYDGQIEEKQENSNDFDNKTRLQEIIQKESKEPLNYEIIEESGPAHDKIFKAQVSHMGETLGEGIGKSKKEAEQNAALCAISEGEF